jgi:hypothetical protein
MEVFDKYGLSRIFYVVLTKTGEEPPFFVQV